MRADRIGRLTHKLGIVLSEEELKRVLTMADRKGSLYLHQLATERSGAESSIDPFSLDPILWTRKHRTFIANSDRGTVLRALDYLQQSMRHTAAGAAKDRSERRELVEIIRYLEKLGEPVEEARQEVSENHHPQQLRLF